MTSPLIQLNTPIKGTLPLFWFVTLFVHSLKNYIYLLRKMVSLILILQIDTDNWCVWLIGWFMTGIFFSLSQTYRYCRLLLNSENSFFLIYQGHIALFPLHNDLTCHQYRPPFPNTLGLFLSSSCNSSYLSPNSLSSLHSQVLCDTMRYHDN